MARRYTNDPERFTQKVDVKMSEHQKKTLRKISKALKRPMNDLLREGADYIIEQNSKK